MDRKEEWREYVRAAWSERAAGPSGHLSEEELVRYHRGQLAEPEQARVEAHLATCAPCLGSLADVSDFLQSISERDEPGFEALWQRVEADASPASERPTPGQAGFWVRSRVLFAVAAGFFVAFALTAMWALSLRSEVRQLAQQPPQSNRAMEQLRHLEQENRGLQEQLKALQQEGRRWQDQLTAAEQEVAHLREPEVNVPVINIYPRDDKQRSGDQTNVNRIGLPAKARTFTLMLSDYEPGHQGYAVELVDPAGRTIWRGDGLKPNEAGDLTVKLDRTFLGRREYTLRLYGQRDGRPRRIAEYLVVVD
jgi:hypothetical protein